MAVNPNNSYLSIGLQSKPPTLISEEFQQWKIRIINFLEGIHPQITEYLHNPPYVPYTIVPRVPATATTAEIPEYYKPKDLKDWSVADSTLVDLSRKCKRMLIMALPNDIFVSLDHCETSMELWAELLRQVEGGAKPMKNNRTLCIDEYHDFKAKDGELLKDTYARFNTLISKCRRSGVIRSKEDNNMLFLKSLGNEWLHLTMSMRATLDLETTSLADLYGTLAAQESVVLQMRRCIGGPLALVAEGTSVKGKEKEERKEERLKKKAFLTQSDKDSDEEKTTTKDLMETIALLTRELKRGYGGRSSGRDNYNRRGYDKGYDRSQDRGYDWRESPERRMCPDRKIKGRKRPKVPQKPAPKVKDEAYFKRKADYYSQKSLLAQSSELITDSSTEEDAPQKGLLANAGELFIDHSSKDYEHLNGLVAITDFDDEEFCGMANGDSESSISKTPEVSIFPESDIFYLEIINNLDSCQSDYNCLKDKLSLCNKEIETLTEERNRFFKMSQKAEQDLLICERSSKERINKLEKEISEHKLELKELHHEKSNAISLKNFFQKEREFLHQDLLYRAMKIKNFRNAQNVFERLKVNMGRRGLGFLEYHNIPKSTLKTPLYKSFKVSKAMKSKESLHLASFKRRWISLDSHARTPLLMKNVSFQDFFTFSNEEFYSKEVRGSKRDRNLQVWISRDSSLYACIDSDPDKESFLSPDANEFYPKEVREVSENSLTSDNDHVTPNFQKLVFNRCSLNFVKLWVNCVVSRVRGGSVNCESEGS
ncbi:hypothetical protein OSB04_007187 [Centaurea solstitialis]|uniref:Uncharacterized protein n=1 Tax=Centaurea solstitialis TaxID=347529 RepID=A0AA38WI90_9ASTR|nr:hypothetical protein OSB04_007187 [Centaurea solstitialis]